MHGQPFILPLVRCENHRRYRSPNKLSKLAHVSPCSPIYPSLSLTMTGLLISLRHRLIILNSKSGALNCHHVNADAAIEHPFNHWKGTHWSSHLLDDWPPKATSLVFSVWLVMLGNRQSFCMLHNSQCINTHSE